MKGSFNRESSRGINESVVPAKKKFSYLPGWVWSGKPRYIDFVKASKDKPLLFQMDSMALKIAFQNITIF